MTRTPKTIALIACLAGWTSAARAQTPGQLTLAGEKATFAPVLGMLDAGRKHVSLVYATKALTPDVEAASRKSGQWDVKNAGPSVIVDFDFTPGSTSAMAGQLKACRIAAAGFKTPLELKGGAANCHILSIGGMLSAPGALMGILQGQGANYSLSLPFSITFQAGDAPAPATTSTAPARATSAPAAASARPAAPSIPPNTVTGSGTYDGQRVTVNQGVAAWNAADGEVRVALFAKVPPKNAVASLLKGDWDEGPVMTLYLRVKGTPSPAAVGYCYVDLDFPRGGTMGTNTNGKGCGITEISGPLTAGGNVAVRLSGQTMGPHDKPFTWDARINLPIAR
jgi:hypothetical protein